LPRPPLDAAALARRARLLDDHPAPGTAGAGLAEREQSLVVVEHAPSAALRADDRAGARRRAAAVAGRTGRVAGDVDRGGDAVDGVEERQVELGLEVSAPLRPLPGEPGAARAAAASEAAEEVAEQ